MNEIKTKVLLLDLENCPNQINQLMNLLKSKFKADNIDATKVLDVLMVNGVISLNENKIIYNQEKLNKFAAVV